MLEIIWLIVGLIAAVGAVNSFIAHDNRNGLIMSLFTLIGFLMFYARRTIRLKRKNENQQT